LTTNSRPAGPFEQSELLRLDAAEYDVEDIGSVGRLTLMSALSLYPPYRLRANFPA